MRDFNGKTYWLIGASEGLGAALASKLSAAGADLVISARNADRLGEVADRLTGNVEILPLDVTDAEAVQRAAEAQHDVDGVVFLSAVYWPMNSKDWDSDRILSMIDVNLSGAVRLVGAVLPTFLKRGKGHIVFTGSLAAFRGLPGSVGYSTSKAALLSLAETMRLDLKGTGVDVQIAHPGFVKTRLTDKNDFNMPSLMTPEQAATYMVDAMRRKRFSTSFPGIFAATMRSLRLVPDWLYFRLFA